MAAATRRVRAGGREARTVATYNPADTVEIRVRGHELTSSANLRTTSVTRAEPNFLDHRRTMVFRVVAATTVPQRPTGSV